MKSVKAIGFVSTFGCGVPVYRVATVVAALSLILASGVAAVTPLHSFALTTQWTGPAGVYFTNSDGAGPTTALVLAGNTLYGATYFSGTNGNGTVFSVNTDGTGFATLHGFTKGTGSDPNLINNDGANPSGGLVLAGNNLYGTGYSGGTNGTGTIFALHTDGTGFATLHNFTAVSPYPAPWTNTDGVNPSADLLLVGNTLYGTCYRGGPGDAGTVFAINTDGTGFAILHSFPAYSSAPDYTNSDGGGLFSGLVLSGNTLYGAAFSGGISGYGTVFALNTNGTGFTNLHNFAVDSDEAKPLGTLLVSGNTLYGAASAGGSWGNGTLFAVNTDGTGFRTLHTFTERNTSSSGANTNTDGSHPTGGLILSGNTLYGMAAFGGGLGIGTMFAVNTDGTGFTTMHSFTGGSDGSRPRAGLFLSDNTLYGAAYWNGAYGNGTVFSISMQPQLTIIPSGPYVILTWPTNYAGFSYAGYTLQSSTTLGSPVWRTNSSPPVVLGGQNVATNPITGAQKFFRLSQ